MYLSEKTKKLLEEKLQELEKHRPISKSILEKIRSQFQIEMTYNSNAIEGNTLTLQETFWVIQEGMTIKGKSLKEHLEVKDHKEALGFLYDLIDRGKQHTVSERLIKEFHQLVLHSSQKDIAGIYREGNVMITGAKHVPPEGFQVIPEMRELIKWLNNARKELHIVELASILHHKFVYIHPFWDGNGRVARLIMNVLIMQASYPLSIILKNDRKRYYRVLSEADKGEYAPLCEFVAQAVLRSLNIYLKILLSSKSEKENFISLKELAKSSVYSVAYLRKLATQGKLEAFKEGKIWLSSKKALDDYINSIKK